VLAQSSSRHLDRRRPPRRLTTKEPVMQIDPHAAKILAEHPNLTEQDLADFASFATDDPDGQATIVQQIRDARNA
jgi:hypothetical protein